MPLFGQSDTSLNIVISAKNEASKTLQLVQSDVSKFKSGVEALQPTFKKMAVIGSTAFAGVALSAKSAIQQAAKAEGSYNKFNTVFGEHADDMMDFVNDIRKQMPSATSEIVRMSADLQDLLVPMGLTRDKGAEMTKGFVDLANKLAAFNDVDPTEVLEAFKSGLSGSSEPLRRFGINALETSLEAKAMNDGLLEAGQTFKDLSPEVRNQVRAQALLAQSIDNSADAISGFEENNDSFIRRQQELNATVTEFKEALGTALLPIVDDLLKKLIPVVENIKLWAEQNPEVAKRVVILAGVLTGLVAIIGILGITVLPLIVAMSSLATATAVAGVSFTALLLPIGLILVTLFAVVSIIVLLVKHWDILKEGAVTAFENIGETLLAVWGIIKATFTNWITQLQIVWIKIKEFWVSVKQGFKDGVNFLIGLAEGWANIWVKAVNTVIKALNKIQVNIPDWIPGIGGKSFGINIPEMEKVQLPRLEHGGRVPGAIGQEVPIIAHGQETIIPASQSPRQGATIQVNIYNPSIRDDADVNKMREDIERALRDVTRVHKLNTI